MNNKNLVLMDFVVYGQRIMKKPKQKTPEDLQKALPDIDELMKLLSE